MLTISNEEYLNATPYNRSLASFDVECLGLFEGIVKFKGTYLTTDDVTERVEAFTKYRVSLTPIEEKFLSDYQQQWNKEVEDAATKAFNLKEKN